MKRPGEERVRSACHNEAPRSSLSSVELNDSSVLSGRLAGRAGDDEMLLPIGHSLGSVEPELAKILDEVRFIAKRFRNQDKDEAVCNEWKFAASVIDRLCLMAFSLFTILCTIGIFMSAPNFVEAISKDFFNWSY